MSATLHRIIVACDNLEQMAAFYEAVLQCSLESVDVGQFQFFDGQLDGITLRLLPAEFAGIDATENRHQLMFGVASLEEVVEQATAHGGRLLDDIRETNEARVCAVRDPDGNSIEFIEPAESHE